MKSSRPWNAAEALAETGRLNQEWHEACATCGDRYQGAGDDCPPCSRKKLDAMMLEEQRSVISSEIGFARETLPPWQDWATFAKLEKHPAMHRRIFEAARDWRHDAGSLVLIGPTGVGKSACAHAIAQRILAAAMATPLGVDWDKQIARRVASGMRWVGGSKLALARKQSRLGDGEAYEVKEAIDATLLIVEELGYEQVVGDGVIFDVINARYERKRHTIVTSGRSEAELVERYGAALMRRLREPGTVVDCHPRNAPTPQGMNR